MATLIVLLHAVLYASVMAQAKQVVVLEVPENKPMTYQIANITMLPDETCSIQTPLRARPYDLYPLADDLPASLEYFDTVTPGGCGFQIKNAAVSDTGNWTILIRSDRNTNQNATVREDLNIRVVVTTRDVVPKDFVSVVSGHDLYLRFEPYAVGNLVECRVNWTNGREVVLRPGMVVDPLVGYWGTGLKEECGVRATGIGIKDAGVWKLLATNTSSHVISGEFNVSVLNTTTYSETVVTFVEQSYEKIVMGPPNSRYCQAVFPNGTMDKPSAKQCAVNLNTVTRANEGTWGARFGVLGQLEEEQTTTKVNVAPVQTFETTLTESKRITGAMDLLCLWTTYQYAKTTALFCRFTRPDGMALSMEDGVGNDHYSYYGDGLNYSPNVKYCGVTINTPSKEDYGTWQCVIGADLSLMASGFIHVPPATKEFETNSFKSDRITVTGGDEEVIVKNGSALTVSCKATISLNYCWFLHPNGTVFAPITTKPESNFYYSGRGLSFGECSLTISKSNIEDSGKWTCNMGIQDLPDIQVAVTARVTHSNLIAKYPKVEMGGAVNNGVDSVSVLCQTVPNSIALQYCRFVRPDGMGFGFTTKDDVVMNRYKYSGAGLEFGQCGLEISPVSREDFGRWQCVALNYPGSSYTVASEGAASFELVDIRELTSGAVTGIVLGTIIAVLIIGTGLFCVYRRYGRQPSGNIT